MGVWELQAESVITEITAVIEFSESGGTWSAGVVRSEFVGEVRGLSVSGADFSCSVRLTKPAPTDLDVVGRVDGDTIMGTAKAKFLPEMTLTGKREGTAAQPAPTAPTQDPWAAVPAAPRTGPGGSIAPGLLEWGEPSGIAGFEAPPPPPPGLVPPPPPPA